MKDEKEKLTDKQLMAKINQAINDWSCAYTQSEFKKEIVNELRQEQVKRLVASWRKKKEI